MLCFIKTLMYSYKLNAQALNYTKIEILALFTAQ